MTKLIKKVLCNQIKNINKWIIKKYQNKQSKNNLNMNKKRNYNNNKNSQINKLKIVIKLIQFSNLNHYYYQKEKTVMEVTIIIILMTTLILLTIIILLIKYKTEIIKFSSKIVNNLNNMVQESKLALFLHQLTTTYDHHPHLNQINNNIKEIIINHLVIMVYLNLLAIIIIKIIMQIKIQIELVIFMMII